MPVEILDRQFDDPFGNALSFYRGNAGDKILARVHVRSTIEVQSSSSNYLTYDPISYVIAWTGGNFEAEGFRTGDNLSVIKYNSSGGIISTTNAVVVNVDGSSMTINIWISWIDATNGEIIRFIVTNRNREGLILDINHVLNGQTGSEFSLIDGEVTRYTFDLTGLTGANSVNGIPVGNQSGQMVLFARIDDKTIAVNGSNTISNKRYDIVVEFINTGMFNASWFSFAGCLKYYLKMRWQSFLGEPYDNFIAIFNEDADTGYFDEPFNTGIINASVVQQISELAFDAETTATFTIDSVSGVWGIGAVYRPGDESYYKNRSFGQQNLSMVLATTNTPVTFPITFTSEFNDSGCGFDFTIVSVNIVGSLYQFEVTFTPNGQFGLFMQGREEGDRLFQVWARFGNVNLLVYNDQLTSSPPIGGPLDFVKKGYLDHGQNVTALDAVVSGYEANVEDDLAFAGRFLLPFNSLCQSLTAKIEAYNSVTGDSFTLQQSFFDIASVPMVGGKHLLNLSQPVFAQLPNTSVKRDCFLTLEPSLDTETDYGVALYLPFIYRWETWLAQANASSDFYPNQNKNWVPYGTTGDWTLRLAVDLIREDLLYEYTDEIIIKDYDSDPTIDQTITLLTSQNQEVEIVTEGDVMTIIADHVLNDGSTWDIDKIWGMITVEPNESSPRWISSTIVPFDNNSLNPLTPINGDFCNLELISATQARMKCFFDTTKINLSNGVKITSKIKQFCTVPEPIPCTIISQIHHQGASKIDDISPVVGEFPIVFQGLDWGTNGGSVYCPRFRNVDGSPSQIGGLITGQFYTIVVTLSETMSGGISFMFGRLLSNFLFNGADATIDGSLTTPQTFYLQWNPYNLSGGTGVYAFLFKANLPDGGGYNGTITINIYEGDC